MPSCFTSCQLVNTFKIYPTEILQSKGVPVLSMPSNSQVGLWACWWNSWKHLFPRVKRPYWFQQQQQVWVQRCCGAELSNSLQDHDCHPVWWLYYFLACDMPLLLSPAQNTYKKCLFMSSHLSTYIPFHFNYLSFSSVYVEQIHIFFSSSNL